MRRQEVRIRKTRRNKRRNAVRIKSNYKGRCPPGYHWVKSYVKKNILGQTTYVEGHCAENGSKPEFGVKEITTRKIFKTPLGGIEKTTTVVPQDVDEINSPSGTHN